MTNPATELDEYRELGLNIRHYSTIQYANLTLSLAIQAALLSTVFRVPPPATTVHILTSIGGLLATSLFFVNETRIRAYWHSFYKRAVELEVALGFAQYSNTPGPSLLRSSVAVRILFSVLLIFWLATACLPQLIR